MLVKYIENNKDNCSSTFKQMLQVKTIHNMWKGKALG